MGLGGQTDCLHPLDCGGFDTVVTQGSPARIVGSRGGPSTDWVLHSGPHEDVLGECPPDVPRFAGVQLRMRVDLSVPISSYREVNRTSTSLPEAMHVILDILAGLRCLQVISASGRLWANV